MIRSLWITFRTGSQDGKDDNTGVLVQLKLSTGQTVARYEQGRNKVYRELLTHTEQLQVFGPVFASELSDAILTIDISPDGDDTWGFDYVLDGTWSDGTPFSDRQFFITLSEDSPHFEKRLSL